MAVKNSLVKANEPKTFSDFIIEDTIKRKINETIGGENGNRFITSILSAVGANPSLQECQNSSILSAALLGEALKLSPSPQLGQYYMVPYKDNDRGIIVAQFQLGYKGYIQLAIRSGYYKKINVLAIKEGELINYDPLTEEIDVKFMDDEEMREEAETIGYYAMFEYVNGFKKSIYWSKKKMLAHAKKYSPGFKSDLNKGTRYTFWSKDFDGMAYKTMLRQLISKWGIMSIDMQSAYEKDMATIKEDGSYEYIETRDEQTEVIDASENRPPIEDNDKKKDKTVSTEKTEEVKHVPTVDEVEQYEIPKDEKTEQDNTQNNTDGILDDFFN